MSELEAKVEGGAGVEADPLAGVRAELESTRQMLEGIRRERDVHRALFEAGVNDLDIGAVMVEREMRSAPEKPAAELVAELRKRKPGLFARTGGAAPAASARAGAMGARVREEDPRRAAAERASSSGDRASLMAYLRLRRQTA